MNELFDASRVLVSIPPDAFVRGTPDRLVFPIDRSIARMLDPVAATALLTVANACSERTTPLYGMMRPEVCTNDSVNEYIEQIIGPFSDHLCMSAGSTIKLLRGKRNHVFLYDLANPANLSGLLALCRRAPEMMYQLSSQMNTAFCIRTSLGYFEPTTIYLDPPRLTAVKSQPDMYEWWMRRAEQEDIQPRTCVVQDDRIVEPTRPVHFISVNRVALQSVHFMKHVSRLMYRALYQNEFVYLQPPRAEWSDFRSWMQEVRATLERSGLKLPFLRTNAIVISRSDALAWLLEARRDQVVLTLHHLDPLWEYNFHPERQPDRVDIVADHTLLDCGRYEQLVRNVLDVPVTVIWPER